MKRNHYYFIGIGGIGMTALASLLLSKGCRVSGSDIKENQSIQKLRSQGATIFIGHNAENLSNVDKVVYSSAIKEDNPEMIRAENDSIPILKRAQLLASIVNKQTSITVSGAHGKTTTTSMAANLLMQADLKPTLAVGGIVNQIEDNAQLGDGKYFVVETDESDGSFLYFIQTINNFFSIICFNINRNDITSICL